MGSCILITNADHNVQNGTNYRPHQRQKYGDTLGGFITIAEVYGRSLVLMISINYVFCHWQLLAMMLGTCGLLRTHRFISSMKITAVLSSSWIPAMNWYRGSLPPAVSMISRSVQSTHWLIWLTRTGNCWKCWSVEVLSISTSFSNVLIRLSDICCHCWQVIQVRINKERLSSTTTLLLLPRLAFFKIITIFKIDWAGYC